MAVRHITRSIEFYLLCPWLNPMALHSKICYWFVPRARRWTRSPWGPKMACGGGILRAMANTSGLDGGQAVPGTGAAADVIVGVMQAAASGVTAAAAINADLTAEDTTAAVATRSGSLASGSGVTLRGHGCPVPSVDGSVGREL